LAKTTQGNEGGEEQRGAVLEVVERLLADGQSQKVKALVKQLLLRNAELEKKLSTRGYKNSEAISSAQLLLLIDGLPQEAGALGEADDKLRVASAIDASRFDEERLVAEAKPAPRLRRPVPEHLRRFDNPIAVPAEERAFPKCGMERS
jgi:hypothetical protein